MTRIVVNKVDGSLVAGPIREPQVREPDFVYDMDDAPVEVWVDVEDIVDLDELDDLIWVTMMTAAPKWRN